MFSSIRTGLTPPTFCACLESGIEIPNSYDVVVFMFNELRNNVVVRFVHIGGIVDIHRLYILIYLESYPFTPLPPGQPLPG
jgi:hypothetical protein